MAKPEWGTKRICLSCGARFYDLNRDPIVCPACGSPHDPMAQSRPRRSRAAPAAAKPVPAPVVPEVEEEAVEESADLEADTEADESAEDTSAKDENEDEEESDSAIEDVSELGDDDMADVIETDLEEDEEGR